MEVLKAPPGIDDDSLTELSDYSDYKIWGAFYGGEEYEGEMMEHVEEDLEDEEEMQKEPEDEDIMADLMTQYQDKRAAMLAAKAEERKEKLRELIGLTKDKDVSEETLITPEEETISSGEPSTESSTHPCLVDIDISDSQLKLQNLYTMFPVPDDPGLVPAFWTLYETQDAYDDDGIRKFFDLTKKLNIKPIQTVKNMLLTDTINLQYYGVNPKVIKPLCEALMNNIFVTTVNLTENWLSEDACYHLGDLLLRNNNIHTLLLAGCRIGAKGAAKLKKGIAQSTALITLDLSSCEIHKEGLEHITEAACNTELETLCLNDNHLDETCADAVRDLILCSSTLKKLELAWNSLYTVETWRKLGRALEENEVLLELDLSWNALGRECIPFLRQFLMRAQSLKKLDLSGNRFYNEDAMNIARGLSRNQSLHELYVGNNPFKAEGALALVQAVTPENSPESQLRLLDLTNIWASKSILPDLETIKNDRPWLDIKLGGILSNYKIEGPNVPAILFKRAIYEAMKPKNKRRRRNFGHFVLSLSDNPISRASFTELVKQFGLKLSPTLVKEIMHAFPGPRHVVDQALLRAAYLKLYPDTKPPPERPIKQKKGKGKKKKT